MFNASTSENWRKNDFMNLPTECKIKTNTLILIVNLNQALAERDLWME